MTQKTFSFDLMSLLVLAVGVCVAAVLVVPAPLPLGFSKSALFAFVVLLSLIIFLIGRIQRGSIILPPVALIVSAWFLVVASGLSVFTYGTPLATAFFGDAFGVDTLGVLILAVLTLTLTALSLRTPKSFSLFARGALVFFGFLVLSQFALLLLGVSGVSLGVPTLLGSVNDLAIVLGAGVLGGMVALSKGALSKRMKVALMVVLIGSLILLMASNNPTVWVVLGIVSLALLFQGFGLLQKKGRIVSDEDEEGVVPIFGKESIKDTGSAEEGGKEKDDVSLVVPMLVFALSALFLLGSTTFGGSIASVFRLSETQIRPSWSATFEVARSVYTQNPLFGAGPTNFFLAWNSYKPQEIINSIFWDTDFTLGVGVVPTYLVTTGLFGVIAWLLFVGLLCFLGVRFFMKGTQKGVRMFSLLSFLLSVYFIVMLTVSVASPLLVGIAFLSVGAFVASTRYQKEGRKEWGIFFARSPKFGFLVVFLMTLGLIGSLGSIYVLANEYAGAASYSRALMAYQAGSLEEGSAHLAEARRYTEKDSVYRLQAAAGVEAMNRIAGDATLTPEAAQARFQEVLSLSVNAGIRATELRPGYYLNWIALGNVYRTVVPLGIPNAYESARSAYLRAEELYPSYPALSFIQAQLEIAQGDAVRALEYVNRALVQKPNYTDAIFLKSQLEVRTGNIDGALSAAEALVYFEPQNQAALYQLALLRSGKGDFAGAKAVLTDALSINPSFANARYILAVILATEGDLGGAQAELERIATISEENARQIESELTALRSGQNPFPPTFLSFPAPLREEGVVE